MESIKEQISAFITSRDIPAERRDVVALFFARSMQRELQQTLWQWQIEIALMEKADRDRRCVRVQRN
jgi:hypothetical protein